MHERDEVRYELSKRASEMNTEYRPVGEVGRISFGGLLDGGRLE